MTNKEFIDAIFKRVEENNRTEFKLLRSFTEYLNALEFYKGTCTLLRRLKRATNKVFKNYLLHLRQRVNQTEELAAWANLQKCVVFFAKEKETLGDMLTEYKVYLFSDHFSEQVFKAAIRDPADLRDFRKVTFY